MDEQLDNSINFLRAMYILAKQSDNRAVEIDEDTLKLLLDLLKKIRDSKV